MTKRSRSTTMTKPTKPRWRTRAGLTTERRTIEWLVDVGYTEIGVELVEVGKCNGTRFSPDLYNVLDLEGFSWFQTVGIQVTDYTSIASHRKKILAWKNLAAYLSPPAHRSILLVGWKKPKKRGDEWIPKWEWVVPGDK